MKTPLAFLCATLLLLASHAAPAWEVASGAPTAITLRDFKLIGDLNSERAAFVRARGAGDP